MIFQFPFLDDWYVYFFPRNVTNSESRVFSLLFRYDTYRSHLGFVVEISTRFQCMFIALYLVEKAHVSMVFALRTGSRPSSMTAGDWNMSRRCYPSYVLLSTPFHITLYLTMNEFKPNCLVAHFRVCALILGEPSTYVTEPNFKRLCILERFSLSTILIFRSSILATATTRVQGPHEDEWTGYFKLSGFGRGLLCLLVLALVRSIFLCSARTHN